MEEPPRPRRAGAAWIATAGALLCCALAGTAHAQAGAACDPAGNQQQMNACTVRDFQAADIQLNIRYGEVMNGLPQGQRTALRQQQRGWLKSRDARCKTAVRDSEGGSVWPLVFHACLEKATRARTAEIERWATENSTP